MDALAPRRTMAVMVTLACGSLFLGSSGTSLGAGGTFVDVTATVPTTLDPAFREGKTSNQYVMWMGTLVRYKKVPLNTTSMQAPFQVEGYLASSWTRVPPSGSTDGGYRFTLRDATSSYGNKLTSADVQWSFQRMMALDTTAKVVLNSGRVDLAN